MGAITKKELRSYFSSPVGYVCVGVILALFGYYFYQVMLLRSSYYVGAVYGTMFVLCMMVIPIITMKTFSEEKKNKTDQALLTAPVSVTAIVMGKFLAAFCVYLIAIVGSMVPVVVISFFSSMNWGMVFGNVIATLLYGAAMIAIGIFISSLTESQIIAAIGSFGVAIFVSVIDQLGSMLGGAAQTFIGWISFNTRYQPFTTGTFDIPSVVFFLSVTAVFVFLTARKLERKRWS